MSANALRGEATFTIAGEAYTLRPTFTALVAAEEELGPLFALVERAGNGRLALSEMAALFWHCLAPPHDLTRDGVGEAVAAQGLAACAVPLRTLLGQILRGTG
ncbi:MAG: gene transfer agent family protein [Parerythrobacter sp.]